MPDLSTGSLDYQDIPVYDISQGEFQLSFSTDFIDYVNLTVPIVTSPIIGSSSHPGKPEIL